MASLVPMTHKFLKAEINFTGCRNKTVGHGLVLD